MANAQNVATNAAMNASAELEAQQTKASAKLAVHEAEHQKIQTNLHQLQTIRHYYKQEQMAKEIEALTHRLKRSTNHGKTPSIQQ